MQNESRNLVMTSVEHGQHGPPKRPIRQPEQMVPLARVLCLGQQRAYPRIGQSRGKHETLKHQREKATAIYCQSLPTALKQRDRIRGEE